MRICFLFFLFIISASIVPAQEICNNGIDDDGNGLIDLNDTASCVCNGISGTTAISSLIPNPSFEQFITCPTGISQMNYATSWIQASLPTPDYMNTCGWRAPIVNASPQLQPFPHGNGIVGAYFAQDFKEYVGACLLQPMLAGQSYTIQVNIASIPTSPFLSICNGGVINYSALDITIFGSTSCSNMPFPGNDCPQAPAWTVLGSTNYSPVSTWGTISITFVPTVNTNAIILGAPCALPSTYGIIGSSCSAYFLFDNLLLNTTSSFNSSTVTQSGLPCNNDVVLDAHIDTTGGSWQWYHNGIALSGQTDSILNVSANSLGMGTYEALYTLGNDCEVVEINVNTPIPSVTVTSHTDVSCSGANDGTATALATNGSGTISYAWNTNPIQNSSTATNLGPGSYIVMITDSAGCSASDTISLSSPPPASVTNNPQTICAGGSYTINGNTYFSPGVYNDTLLNSGGCDSIVITQLVVGFGITIMDAHSICAGGSYTVGTNTYTTQGIYYDSLLTLGGCDSIIVTNLTVGQAPTMINQQSICSGTTYTVGTHTYDSTGTYYDTLQTSLGCDSIIITILTSHLTIIDNPQSICEGDSYSINSNLYTMSGLYYDTLTTVAGCDSIIKTVIVTRPLPQITVTHPSDVCIDGPALPLNFITPAGGTYTGPAVMNNVFYPDQAQSGIHPYSYVYLDSATNCSVTVNDHVTVWPLPEIQFTLSPKVTFLTNPEINYIDYTNGGWQWQWNFGDSSGSTGRYGIHTYSDTGFFHVTLEVIDIHGCRSSASDDVYIGLEFSFNIPNAFTPNGDGKNETFNGVGIGISKYDMKIFNRWGSFIFETDNLYRSWSGDDAPAGTYIYKVHLEDITGKEHDYTGVVSIVR